MTRKIVNWQIPAILIVIISTILRLVYVFHFRINSDESQHLHVVWGWAQGLLPYRDYFDNHMPLFHVVCLPFFKLMGERPDAVIIMRLLMLPIAAAIVYFTYRVGEKLFSKTVALWSAALLSVHNVFLFKSLEFRADNLWALAWLIAVYILISGRLSLKRSFFAGIFAGVAIGVSLKSMFLLVCLLVAIVLVYIMSRFVSAYFCSKNVLFKFSLFIAGALVAPSLITVYFAKAGAVKDLIKCTLLHNITSPTSSGEIAIAKILPVFIIVPIIWLTRKKILNVVNRTAIMQAVLLIFVCLYVFIAKPIFMDSTMQNYLPAQPLLAVFIAGVLAVKFGRVGRLILIAICIVELIYVTFKGPFWVDKTISDINMVGEILKLTDPGETVFDAKGETIFRPRACYEVFEHITVKRLDSDQIYKTIEQGFIQKKCYVAVFNGKQFPQDVKRYMDDNFLRVGYLRIAGKVLQPVEENRDYYHFCVDIPAFYRIVEENGDAVGLLDGEEYKGKVFLGAGCHEFVLKNSFNQKLILVWAQAIDRGFLPDFSSQK